MNIDRMNRLTVIMQNVEKDKKAFSIDRWISGSSNPEQDEAFPRNNLDYGLTYCDTESFEHGVYGDFVNTCGTVCCALGYATLDEKFQKEGLSMLAVIKANNNDDNSNNKEKITVKTIDQFNHMIKYGRIIDIMPYFCANDDVSTYCNGYAAAASFFDIDIKDAYEIFNPENYYSKGRDKTVEVTPALVISRIEEIIKKNQKVNVS